MKILALDTSTEACSCALLHENKLIEHHEIVVHRHADRILPMIEALLAEAGVTLQQLSAIAFGRGPGSFTGARIAAAVTQGLAFGLTLPVIPVSTLCALAQAAYREFEMTHVLTALDARMGEIYWGAFRLGAADVMEGCEFAEQVVVPTAAPLPAAGQWFGIGSGWELVEPSVKERLQNRLIGSETQCYPRAGDIARIALVEYQANRAVTPDKALPVYLRDKVTH